MLTAVCFLSPATSCPKGLITVAEAAHPQCGVQECETGNTYKVVDFNIKSKCCFLVSMSKRVFHQHKNKSLNKLQTEKYKC